MRLVAYCRLSISNGSDSLEAQEQAIRAWAAAAGHDVAAVCRDSVSGARGEEARDGLASAIALVEDGEADGIAVKHRDRFARALHVQEAALDRVWKADGAVFETTSGEEIKRDDPDDPYRTFARQVMGAAAQLERGMIVARMQAGRRRKAGAGGHVGGDAPYGWRVEGEGREARLVEVPEEQAVAARVVELRRRSRGTLRAVAEWLDQEGLRTRTGGRWTASQVSRVLRRAGHS